MHILVVDDDSAGGGGAVVEKAVSLKVQAIHVPSALLALDMIAATSFRAIITDIFMPDIDGIEFLWALKARGIRIQTAAMMEPSSLFPSIEKLILGMGGLMLFAKPVRIVDLRAFLGMLRC